MINDVDIEMAQIEAEAREAQTVKHPEARRWNALQMAKMARDIGDWYWETGFDASLHSYVTGYLQDQGLQVTLEQFDDLHLLAAEHWKKREADWEDGA